jgi:hypothetical protein
MQIVRSHFRTEFLSSEICDLKIKLAESENTLIKERDLRATSERERSDFMSKNMELQSEMLSFNKYLRENRVKFME